MLATVFFAGLPAGLAGYVVGSNLPKLLVLLGMYWLAKRSHFAWAFLLAFLYVVFSSQTLLLGFMSFAFFWPIHWQALLLQVTTVLTVITMLFALIALLIGDKAPVVT